LTSRHCKTLAEGKLNEEWLKAESRKLKATCAN
jgi:hypothetical protein